VKRMNGRDMQPSSDGFFPSAMSKICWQRRRRAQAGNVSWEDVTPYAISRLQSDDNSLNENFRSITTADHILLGDLQSTDYDYLPRSAQDSIEPPMKICDDSLKFSVMKYPDSVTPGPSQNAADGLDPQRATYYQTLQAIRSKFEFFLSLPSFQPVTDFPTGNRVRSKPSYQTSCVRSRNHTGNPLLNNQANHRHNQLQIRASSSHDRQSRHSRLINQVHFQVNSHHRNRLGYHPQLRVCNHLLSRRPPLQARSHHSNALQIREGSRLRNNQQHGVYIHRRNHLLSRLTRARSRHRSLLSNSASNRANGRSPRTYRISRLSNHQFNRLLRINHPFNRRIYRRR
jgi:hypothetical protein